MQYKKGNGRKPGPTTNQKPPGSYCYTSGQCFAKLGTTFKTFRPKIKKFVGILQLNCCKLHAAYPFDNYETDHYEQVAGKYGIENVKLVSYGRNFIWSLAFSQCRCSLANVTTS